VDKSLLLYQSIYIKTFVSNLILKLWMFHFVFHIYIIF